MRKPTRYEIVGVGAAVLLWTLAAAAVLWWSSQVWTVDLPESWPEGSFVPGRILVKPIVTGTPLEGTEAIPELGIVIVDVFASAGESLSQATVRQLGEIRGAPGVKWAELDYLIRLPNPPKLSSARVPITPSGGVNDPYFGAQWGLHRIEGPAAWDVSSGDFNTPISIIDTGYDHAHHDLRVAREKDYVDNDDIAQDDHGHGTHTTGIVGAIANNGVGVAGTAPTAAIWHCRALDAQGMGAISNIARCITWSAGYGAKVISMSFGGPTKSQTLEDAVQYARQHGAILVAAAGNSPGGGPQWPAAYGGVVGVGATDANDRRASFSSYGNWVSISAPGENIVSACRGNQYCYMSGTSMSAPFVAGVAGLVLSEFPNADATQRLLQTADALRDAGMGGRVNARRAVSDAAPPLPTVPVPTVTAPAPTPPPSDSPEGEVARLINKYRGEQGLLPLARDSRLDAAARRHSLDMDQSGFCGHYGSDGSDPFTRMRDAGYNYPYSEIVACGYQTARDAVEGWKASPGHNALLLCRDDACRDFGVGIVEKRYTVVFGRGDPSSPVPTPTPTPAPTPIPVEGFWLWCTGDPLVCTERTP